jgi:predicted  nucleic acid-binding Zn-ribbon protein
VDEPLRQAKADLEKMRQKAEAVTRKKKEKEKALEETQEKIRKMKARAADLKTNKEYQAHLKEVESSEHEISGIEDQILQVMVEMDATVKETAEREKSVRAEDEKIQAFKKELDAEVARLEQELSGLREEREKIVSRLDPEVYSTYLMLLKRGSGVAISSVRNDTCMGCDMTIPPQLTVEVKKGNELVQCPQCYRILYCEEGSEPA